MHTKSGLRSGFLPRIRFIVPADENLIAFPKVESAIPSLSLSF